MMDAEHPEMRKKRTAITEILEQLAEGEDAAKYADQRSQKRHAYRGKPLVVQVEGESKAETRHSAVSRDLSSGGMSFLIGTYVYPHSKCAVRLVGEYGNAQFVVGKIVRCRYVEGSASVYEVGVRFDEPIDVAVFQPAAATIRVLLADDDPFQHQIVAGLLRARAIQLTCVEDGRQAVTKATAETWDLILMDVEMPVLDGLTAVRELRKQGFARPIVAVTASISPNVRNECLSAGCTDFISKPFSRDTLVRVVTSFKTEPLISTVAHERDMSELIDTFVGDLSERVSQLETAFGNAELGRIGEISKQLKAHAGACGFEIITDLAAELERLTIQSADIAEIREKLNLVTRWCLAARPVSVSGN